MCHNKEPIKRLYAVTNYKPSQLSTATLLLNNLETLPQTQKSSNIHCVLSIYLHQIPEQVSSISCRLPRPQTFTSQNVGFRCATDYVKPKRKPQLHQKKRPMSVIINHREELWSVAKTRLSSEYNITTYILYTFYLVSMSPWGLLWHLVKNIIAYTSSLCCPVQESICEELTSTNSMGSDLDSKPKLRSFRLYHPAILMCTWL